MALKRKLSQEFDDAAYIAVRPTAKKVQVSFSTELFPTSDSDMDMDVDMSDTSGPELSPLAIPDHPFHTRLDSNASDVSPLDSPRSSPDASPRMVGLMQPKGTGFTHHGQNCSQIPKLRMACSSGPHGQRTMWAHCEQCGAIEMVDTD